MTAASGRVTFGPFELDLGTGELWKGATVLRLQPQPATVLCLLVRAAGRLVTRDEIRQRLWGDSTFVDYDVGVDYCVNRVRGVLGDRAQAPRYVETLPRRGYRFIAPVERKRPFTEPTLAVLPFANLNADPAQEYFADGVTDALITELARIPSVRVLSRQSILHLKGSRSTLAEIARDLDVDGVVEGAALHEGARVRLSAQLILADPERHVWAQAYECDMSAVLATQRSAALAIAASVAGALSSDGASPPEGAGRGPSRPVAPEIVERYLRAGADLSRASADGFASALRYFREITLEAPDFAPGLAGHAVCLFCLGWFGHVPAREVYPAAMRLAEQAVALDERESVARNALATMKWLFDGDVAGSEAEFRRALALSPSSADGHTLYSLMLSGTGRCAESIVEAEYALRLGPTSLIQHQALAWVYLHACQYERAEAQARRAIERFPDALQPHLVLGWALWRQGSRADAVEAFERSVGLSREALSLSFLAHTYGRLDRRDEAGVLLAEIERLAHEGHASPIAFVVAYAGLGDLDAAFDWLDTAARIRSDLVWLTAGFPGIDPLRPDPRFGSLLSRVGRTR